MKKEVKKRKKKINKKIKKKKVIKKRNYPKTSNVKNLKLFNIDKFKHNFAVFKLVSLIGVTALFNADSHNSEKYKEEPVKNVEYISEISNLNINFNKVNQMSNYNLNVRLNTIKSGPIENIEKDNDEVIDEQLEGIPLKYREVVKILEIKEPSLCGMKLSREYEKIIIDISHKYGIDPEIMLTLGDQESDGKWDNLGKISETNDYGPYQINEINHQHIKEVFGFTSEDLLYDPIKSAEAAAYLISKIMLRNDVNSLDEIFGMYNGWTNWRNIEWSVNYVNECFERINRYFPNYTYENNKELLKRM